MAINIVTPLESGHKNKPTPEGSHVSSIYYRKAQNGLMKTFIIAGGQMVYWGNYAARDQMGQ